MNGVHDLGGMHGFGPVAIERDEPVFHEEWEGRVFAMLVAVRMAGHWNIDQSRFAREQMPPIDYLASSYYERWLYGFLRLLDEQGLVSREEVSARFDDPASPFEDLPDTPRAISVDDLRSRSGGRNASKSDEDIAPRFLVGDHVVTRMIQPVGHTRLPRYARGRRGIVILDHGVWALPDSSGNGLGPNPQHCYCVRFDARELWGDAASSGDSVHVDLWDDHLEPA
jgi:nitrile hydratase beta subunit